MRRPSLSDAEIERATSNSDSDKDGEAADDEDEWHGLNHLNHDEMDVAFGGDGSDDNV
jgi:hypothetical protein